MIKSYYTDLSECFEDIDKSINVGASKGIYAVGRKYNLDVVDFTPILTGATRASKIFTYKEFSNRTTWNTDYVEKIWHYNKSGEPKWNEYTWERYENNYIDLLKSTIEQNL